jgi:hypothetical protein
MTKRGRKKLEPGKGRPETINIRVTAELKGIIEMVAARDDRSISQTCERILSEWFLDEIPPEHDHAD